MAVVDEVLQTEGTEKLKEELTEYLGADGKYRKIIIDDSFYMDDGGLEKLEVYLYNKQIDVVIADEAVYKELAGYGFFLGYQYCSRCFFKICRSVCESSRI